MGIVLDSSILIDAERRKRTVLQLLEGIRIRFGNAEFALSVVTVAELVHGAYRARIDTQRAARLKFVDRLCRRFPVHPFTIQLARTLGRIEGQQAARGNVLAFEDLAIGLTALHLGFVVVTLNGRHFERIPGLGVISNFSTP
jgi:tRNA(fMet)-specific endonuclease VapC